MLISELLQPIDFKPYFPKIRKRISPKLAPVLVKKYLSGWSLYDISKHFDLPKTSIRKELLRQKIELRTKAPQVSNTHSLMRAKSAAQPYFGFCFFEGKVIRNPIEFPTLQVIHNQWVKNKSTHQIMKYLNQARLAPRKCKIWSWAAVSNVVARFENKRIILKKGGKYELR